MTKSVPFVEYLVLGDDPHLLAWECVGCGALFFDRRNACARCGGQEFERKRLAGSGTVKAFSIIHRATPDIPVPYISAIVELDGGGTVKANLVDLPPHPEAVGRSMRVQMTTYSIGVDPEGTEAFTFGYAPVRTETA